MHKTQCSHDSVPNQVLEKHVHTKSKYKIKQLITTSLTLMTCCFHFPFVKSAV